MLSRESAGIGQRPTKIDVYWSMPQQEDEPHSVILLKPPSFSLAA